MRMRLFVLLVVMLMLIVPVRAQDTDTPTMTCPASESLTFGLQEVTFTVDDVTRSAFVYVPETYDPTTPAPLVMSFHGFASNPLQQRVFSAWDSLADTHGFIAAYPKGTGFLLRWNSGKLGFGDSSADDVAYVGALIDTLSERFCIDATRVYANGLSNGGGMSYRLACELSDRITAMGGVAGYYTLATCEPTRAVPAMIFHGDADPIVPIEGTEIGIGPSPDIADWVLEWSVRNDCQTVETLETVGTVSGTRYTDCTDNADVVYYVVGGGGHTWPGGGAQPAFTSGPTNRDVDASALMWAFFSQYALPTAQ